MIDGCRDVDSRRLLQHPLLKSKKNGTTHLTPLLRGDRVGSDVIYPTNNG